MRNDACNDGSSLTEKEPNMSRAPTTRLDGTDALAPLDDEIAAVAGVAAEIGRIADLELAVRREFDLARTIFAAVCPDAFAMAPTPRERLGVAARPAHRGRLARR
jgi:hypothetical protein